MPWGDFQNHPHWMNVVWIPRIDTLHKLLDVIGNVLLYVPFGYGFVRGFQGHSPRSASVLGAAALSIVSEGTQLYSHSRVPSLPDIVCNVAGAWIGAALAARHVGSTTA
jgi:glycopeptide antibiotics resistance protein